MKLAARARLVRERKGGGKKMKVMKSLIGASLLFLFVGRVAYEWVSVTSTSHQPMGTETIKVYDEPTDVDFVADP